MGKLFILAALLLTGCPSSTPTQCHEETRRLNWFTDSLRCNGGAELQIEKVGEDTIAKCVCQEKKP